MCLVSVSPATKTQNNPVATFCLFKNKLQSKPVWCNACTVINGGARRAAYRVQGDDCGGDELSDVRGSSGTPLKRDPPTF